MAEDEENNIIARLRDQFEDRCETLDGLHLQTREEWLGKRAGKTEHAKWKSKASELDDQEIGLKVSNWKEIPYINALTYTSLTEDIGFALALRDRLTQMFADGEYGLGFSESWGLFRGLISEFDMLLDAKPENRAKARTLTCHE